MVDFHIIDPSLESQWRAIILFGKNSATYKFAFAKTLIELSNSSKSEFRLEDLSESFVLNIIEHLKTFDKQGNSSSSKFLNSCREYLNDDKSITFDKLKEITTKFGFVNVIDAFHIVNGEPIKDVFYQKDYSKQIKKIVLTDEIFKLKETFQFINLPGEVEARWKLVETAWNLKINPRLLEVSYDDNERMFFLKTDSFERIDVTSSRDSLNGYQRGKCFYCKSEISINSRSDDLCEVDHFIPHTYARYLDKININGVWNLVLACQSCNREKLARLPEENFLYDLFTRNEYYIESKHPLAETIIKQSGLDSHSRQSFLKSIYQETLNYSIHKWKPKPNIQII